MILRYDLRRKLNISEEISEICLLIQILIVVITQDFKTTKN